jgi:two-component system phosphate regulon sensor histidine kinase PhoR
MRTVEEFIVAPIVQAQKLKPPAAHEFQTTLVGVMGHDLRQSLHVIRGTYALLRSRLREMPQRAWLDRGERAATKLTEQLNCLVDAFYLAEHVNALEVSSVGLGPLFWQLRHENEDAAIQRAIDIRAFDTKASVVSNSLLLRCILRNLITNAIKYTEPGGRILIGCRRRGPEIQDRRIRHGHRHPRRPVTSNLRRIYAPYPWTRLWSRHRALYRSSCSRCAWSPHRSSIRCG